jgi:hypothetical protein
MELFLQGRKFSARFGVAETSELEEEIGVSKISYVFSVISNDYFEDFSKWSQQVRAVLGPIFPSACITCIQDYVLYEPAEDGISRDISSPCVVMQQHRYEGFFVNCFSMISRKLPWTRAIAPRTAFSNAPGVE